MGYCFSSKKSDFKISNTYAALDKLKELDNLKWVGNVKGHYLFDDALKDLHWDPIYDKNGNICEIEFFGEKIGDEFIFFNAIAEFVIDGSYIECIGEDGYLWRWVFKESKCYEIKPRIVWD